MNILLLGSGGREHALSWKLAQSRVIAEDGGKLYASPGNPGIADYAECLNIDVTDHELVVAFCEQEQIGLVVIGPEAPLVDGLADSLRAEGISVFGPSAAAAQLEGSKGFTKELCDRANIPTAAYVRTSSLEEAVAALDKFSAPFVLKADGLAAGKGVVIAETRADMFDGAFGAAGAEVVIEEFMTGEEVSLFILTDGATIVTFGSAQDHKRVGEGDTGPNTGGMGAYSPARVLTPELRGEVMAKIIAPTIKQMADEGSPYSGVLYAGLMLTDEGPKLVEYNCRFGDPECQVLMMRLEDDLADYMLACAENRLASMERPRFSTDSALTVVMAAKGYPGTPEKGGEIGGIAEAEADGAKVFHAGTTLDWGDEFDADKFDGDAVGGDVGTDEDGGDAGEAILRASGGRVLNVTARGADVKAAQEAAYAAVAKVDFPSGFYRTDIGWREVARN